MTHLSPFIYDGFTPANRTTSPLTLIPPPAMMHMPATVPPPPKIYSPAELRVQTVHHTLHYPVHNPAAISNWWPKPNYGPIRMNTNWNPHSLNSIMSTNLYAMTMNPYFMANPHNLMMANGMMNNPMMGGGMMGGGMMGGAQGMEAGQGMGAPGMGGEMKYNGDGFEQSYLNQGGMQADASQAPQDNAMDVDMGENNLLI